MAYRKNEHRGGAVDLLLAALDYAQHRIATILQIGVCIEVLYRPALRLFMAACYEAEGEANCLLYR